jgi:glycosyltransferase involved in cell wall biosynthesis
VAAEISIVVICYEMARVIRRTLLSLSPNYQRDCPAGRCEIILIDNGSRSPPPEDQFASLGLNLVYHRLPKISDTPVEAVNFGLRQASAPLIGVWIDGARLASPGLVDSCALAASLHPRPVVATYNYHLGPAFQATSMARGYDASEEDRLLESIGWPNDGSRLFEIAVPSWRSGVGGPILESNALFMTRDFVG